MSGAKTACLTPRTELWRLCNATYTDRCRKRRSVSSAAPSACQTPVLCASLRLLFCEPVGELLRSGDCDVERLHLLLAVLLEERHEVFLADCLGADDQLVVDG